MSGTTIYHNPRCSKSRAALELLIEKDIDAKVVKYLDTHPTRAEIENILELLEMEPRELMRKGEQEYSENNLDDPSLSRDQLIDAMVNFPRLIERPIVIKDGKAAIGRPIQNIIDIL
jgi:arsenate reductase